MNGNLCSTGAVGPTGLVGYQLSLWMCTILLAASQAGAACRLQRLHPVQHILAHYDSATFQLDVLGCLCLLNVNHLMMQHDGRVPPWRLSQMIRPLAASWLAIA
jgi:hypothetical protein